jgi:hypothetical protein
MKCISLTILAVLSLWIVACSSEQPSYKEQNGRVSQTVPAYSYAGNANRTPASVGPSNPAPPLSPARLPAQWPRIFIAGNTTNTVYQPQVDSWDGTTLVARSAVSVQGPGQAQPVYGVVNLKATTLVDKTDRTVNLVNVQLVNADFPSAADKTQTLLTTLREQFPKQLTDMSLDSLEASLAANEEQLKANAQPLNNTPPKIIVSTAPSVLVSIDGPPVYRPVTGTDLERIVNTSVLLVKDKQARPVFYLRGPSGYFQAPSLDGPWALGSPPPGAELAEKAAAQADQTDFTQSERNAQQPSETPGTLPPPVIYVSTTPTELISFSGQPDFVPIPGTKLLYAGNTSGNVFKLMSDQQTYILIAGRWYRGPGLGGPWEYVPGTQLPRDFAQIPDSSPKENVKASVPGTPQAREALIANSIPQTSAVSRNSQIQDPAIDGPPQLAPIEGTPLQYVINSGTPIIRVDEKSWYACQNGAWYVATSVNGPWSVAVTVPAVIYSIPASSPMHYVTYVRVYNSNPEVAYVGYTPGYLGTVVSSDYVVVYGTGYYYSPWIGSVWYAPPLTWGYGCGAFWAPWAGWSFGFGFGWYAGYYPYYWYPYPCWGPYWNCHHYHSYPYHGPGGYAHTAVNVYHRSPARTPVPATRATMASQRPVYGHAYNSRTGTLTAGERAQVQNVYRDGLRPAGRMAPGANNANNVFATRDGRVYIRDGQGRSASWHATPATHPGARGVPTADLERQYGARSAGERNESAARSSEGARPSFTPPPSAPPAMRGGDGGGGRAPVGGGEGRGGRGR